MTAAGWTSEEFDATPLPVVFELLEYWSKNPPTHVIQAAKAGLGKAKRKPTFQREKKQPKPVNPAYEKSVPEWVREARNKQREMNKE